MKAAKSATGRRPLVNQGERFGIFGGLPRTNHERHRLYNLAIVSGNEIGNGLNAALSMGNVGEAMSMSLA